MLKNCQRRVSYERSRRKISSTDSKVKKNFQETIIDPLLVSFPYFQHGEWMCEGGGKKQRWSIHLLESVKG